jgi:uncharacterized protein YecE (DUF72 family)
MAEQFSLFPGDAQKEPPAKKRASSLFDPTTLKAPPKRGPAWHRFGTSSWTYPGWHGSVYRDVESYGSSQRFTELCLAEYARDPRFRCAGADNMYYMPPSARPKLLERYGQLVATPPEPVPEPFELLPKVWHGITVNRYSPLQQREWRLSGEVNTHFLDAARFLDMVALPLQEHLGRLLGPLILEFQENDIHTVEFLQLLDEFLTAVRARWEGRIAVELRTQAHFGPRYLDLLFAHGCGHVHNAWTRMPGIGWQHEQLRARHGQGWPFFVVRALLRGGVRYEDASAYAPYDRVIARAPEVRADILRLLREAAENTPCYVLVNNHLEGHSPGTIAELQAELYDSPATAP